MEEELLIFREELKKSALVSKRILLTTHMGPDDDAIGSILSVYAYLAQILNIDENKIRMRISGKIRGDYTYFQIL
jgi:nanoRNase/pAp phosphatase (c-di-AMP/oligoRNAs hydrolase)